MRYSKETQAPKEIVLSGQENNDAIFCYKTKYKINNHESILKGAKG